MSTAFSEKFIQDSFHSYLKSSLAQAKAEHLLDADVLSSAEADLMITGNYIHPSFSEAHILTHFLLKGPALCLYIATLRCRTHPPSVPLS